MANGQIRHDYPRTILRSGSDTTPIINIYGNTLAGFKFPTGFEGSSITLKAGISADAVSLVPVIDPVTGAEISIAAGADKFVPVNPADLAALQYFTIKSSSLATADREIIMIVRPAS